MSTASAGHNLGKMPEMDVRRAKDEVVLHHQRGNP
jgi:hypothetical protein